MTPTELEAAFFHYGKLKPPRWGAVAFNVLNAGLGINNLSEEAKLRVQLLQVIADWIDAHIALSPVDIDNPRRQEARARALFMQAVAVFGSEGNPDYWPDLWLLHSEWFIHVTTARAKELLGPPRKKKTKRRSRKRGTPNRVNPRRRRSA
jgi:hypothetical protein